MYGKYGVAGLDWTEQPGTYFGVLRFRPRVVLALCQDDIGNPYAFSPAGENR